MKGSEVLLAALNLGYEVRMICPAPGFVKVTFSAVADGTVFESSAIESLNATAEVWAASLEAAVRPVAERVR